MGLGTGRVLHARADVECRGERRRSTQARSRSRTRTCPCTCRGGTSTSTSTCTCSRTRTSTCAGGYARSGGAGTRGVACAAGTSGCASGSAVGSD